MTNDNTIVPPSEGKESDITALSLTSGSLKRKRSQVLKPVLKGSLKKFEDSNGKIVWSGCWGLTTQEFSDPFAPEVIRAPFYFERKSCEDASKSCNLLSDGYYSGYFCMQDMSKAPNQSTQFTKHFENNILLRFSKVNGSSSEFTNVVGSGENRFGKFLIEGRFDHRTHELSCARNYIPKILKRRSIVSNASDSSEPRRSSRDRHLSLKMKESYISCPTVTPSEKLYEFDGRKELLQILESSQGTISDIPKVLEKYSTLVKDLQNQQVKSFSKVKYRLLSIVKMSDSNNWAADVIEKVKNLESKYVVNVKPPVTQQTEEPVTGTEYVSLFDCITDIEQIDPMAVNKAAKFPDVMRSPTLIDIAGGFNDVPALDIIKSSSADGEGLLPIGDVDFSDLNSLDSETIKQLNMMVEFNCPSKGA